MDTQTLQDALALLRPGDTIAVAAYFHEPRAFLAELHTAAAQVDNLSLWTSNVLGIIPIMGEAFDRIHWLSSFYERHARAAHPRKQVTYYPSDLHATGAMMVEAQKPTVFAAAVPPMEPDGTYCISTSLQWEPECAAAADRIILEVNPAIPCADSPLRIPRERVACAYEAGTPVPVLPYDPRITPEEAAIGGYVSELIHDGDCVQFGLGGTPVPWAAALTGKQDLGIHTEMLGNAMMNLIRSGAVTNRRKSLHPGRTVCTFALGDEDALGFLREHPEVMFRPAAYTNHPRHHRPKRKHGFRQHGLTDRPAGAGFLGNHRQPASIPAPAAHWTLPTAPTVPPTAAPSLPSLPLREAVPSPASAGRCLWAVPCPSPGTLWTMW